MSKKKRLYLFLLVVTTTALFYRFYGLADNHPFWVDEFSTAVAAQQLLLYGNALFNNANIYLDTNNFLTNGLVAFFFKLWGTKEWVARLPFVIIGSMVPVAAFFAARRIFNTTTAIGTALLLTFSYLEITWSRQARGYVLQQFLILTGIYLYTRIRQEEKVSPKLTVGFLVVSFLGIITHAFYLLFLGALIVDFLLTNRQGLKQLLRKKTTYIIVFLATWLLFATNLLPIIVDYAKDGLLRANNVWYYHSYLWREYGMLTFLGIIGLLVGFFRKRLGSFLLLLFIIIHLGFISFVYYHYISKYLLPIMPLLFMGMAYAIFLISQQITETPLFVELYKGLKKIIPQFPTVTIVALLLTIAIIGNGHKFVNKPQRFYSVNYDFREIALVDYHQIYDFIKKTPGVASGKTAIIETWPARRDWYVGINVAPSYVYRWTRGEGTVNGVPLITNYEIDKNGQKIVDRSNGLILVATVDDLEAVMKKHDKGFLLIDDLSLPQEVQDFAQKNLEKEIYLEHYPLDENPYAVWPTTLYSWGIND